MGFDLTQFNDRQRAQSLRTVAVLCVSPRSAYKSMAGVECYDMKRDVRTFTGGLPVVAHPPCAPWSAYCSHQWHPVEGIRELGPLCVQWLRKCGGVLEHPAHSRLWAACDLPWPGSPNPSKSEWSIEVSQAWFGDTRTKKTWLCFFHIKPSDVHLPLKLHDPRGDRRRWQLMSHTQRSSTCRQMAEWLVDVARKAHSNGL